MVRSAHALLAVLILPGFLLAQQAPRTHTVVGGDTLWDLANTFYSNPFDWRRIWEANRAAVENPNLILPGQVLTIPDGTTTVTDVTVEADASGPMIQPARRDGPGRTIFYRQPATLRDVTDGARTDYVAVSRDQVYSAPWLIRLEEEPEHQAVVSSFATGSGRSETPRSYDRVVLTPRPGATLRVGDGLRTYRVGRTVPDVGRVVLPTGVLTVTDVGPDGAVAVVTKEFERMALGDLVGPLPAYGLQVGELPQPVSGGPDAMVMGFAGTAELQDIGAMAFLDRGADQGVAVGDVFEYMNARAGENIVEGRLQVVGVSPGMATARIVEMDDAVFQQGIVVRLARKMR